VLHRIALPVVSEWYQDERQLQSDGRSHDTPLATFGATIRCHQFLGVAAGCRNRLSKLISLQAVARCFCV